MWLVSPEFGTFAGTVLLSEIPIGAWSVCGRVVFGEVTISNHLLCFILMQTAPLSSSQDCPTNSLKDRDEICATAGEASWEACLTFCPENYATLAQFLRKEYTQKKDLEQNIFSWVLFSILGESLLCNIAIFKSETEDKLLKVENIFYRSCR